MVRKIGALRRYQPLHEGLPAMTALVVLREKVIRPRLAAGTRPDENFRAGMRGLFIELGVVKIDNLFFIPSDKRLVESRTRAVTIRQEDSFRTT